MWVEALEHAYDGIIYQFVFIERIDIESVDGELCHLQFAQSVESLHVLGFVVFLCPDGG